MGAATALLAAIRAPRRLAALVLVAPPAGWQSQSEKAEHYQQLAHAADLRGAMALAEAWPVAGQPPFLRGTFDGPAELITRHLFAMDQRALPCILRGAALSDLGGREQVHNVIVPTLILAWDGDPGHPLPVAEELATLMVQSELHIAGDPGDVQQWPSLVRDFISAI
jgi:pimeloyl-ACP methyl ester carboxylesterase